MIDLCKGDGLVLKSGSRFIVESKPFLMWGSQTDWRVAAWDEAHEYRFPIQVIAIVEVWRDGKRIDNQQQVQQLSLFEDIRSAENGD